MESSRFIGGREFQSRGRRLKKRWPSVVDFDRKCFSLRTECYKLHERVDGKFLGGVGVLEATNEKEDVKMF